jgi:hypothetical protein
MAKSDISNKQKIKISVVSALLFLLISSPFLYKLVDGLLGKLVQVADYNGCPTVAGLVIHAVVFGLIVYLLMQVPQLQ